MLKGFSTTWSLSLRLGITLGLCSFILMYTSIVLVGSVKPLLPSTPDSIWSRTESLGHEWVLIIVFVLSIATGVVLLERLLKYVYRQPLTNDMSNLFKQDLSGYGESAGVLLPKVLLLSPFLSGFLLLQLPENKGQALMYALFMMEPAFFTQALKLWSEHVLIVLGYCLLALPIHARMVKQHHPYVNPFSHPSA